MYGILGIIAFGQDWQLIAAAGAFMAGLGGLLSGVAALRMARNKGKEEGK